MSAIYSNITPNFKIFTLPTGPLQTNSTFIIHKESKKLILIDSGHEAELSLKVIKEEDLSLERVLLTHAHFDHIGALQKIMGEKKYPLHMHKDDLALYQRCKSDALRYGLDFSDQPKVSHFFSDEDELLFFENDSLRLKVIHTPGHTAGGTCFFTESFGTPLLVAGDTLFSGSIGRTDLPGGNHEQLLDSIRTKLFSLPPETIVITGHGETTTIGKESRTNPFVKL